MKSSLSRCLGYGSRTVAARHGCAVLLVGHLNKHGGKAAYRGLGSIDIFAAARSVMTVGLMPADDNIRAFIHNKSNLAPVGAPQAFGLDTSGGFIWLGDCDVTIDEMLKGTKRSGHQFTKARYLIETALAKGPVPSADMEQMAEEQGISAKTLNRAKNALGVISIKRGAAWYWELPINAEYSEVNQDGQGGHDEMMTTLTVFAEGMED